MASNKKTEAERHAVRDERNFGDARADLEFIFGVGSLTAAGAMGLRSTFGAQLDAARVGATSTRSPNVDAQFDRMDDMVDASTKERCIWARFGQVSRTHQSNLRLAFNETALPGGLPALAVKAPIVIESWGKAVVRMGKRYVEGIVTGRAASDEAERKRQAEAAAKALKSGRKVKPSKDAPRPPEAVSRIEASDVASRWASDAILIGEHTRTMSAVERELAKQQVEEMTNAGLLAYVRTTCWPARDDHAKRCDRCGWKPWVCADCGHQAPWDERGAHRGCVSKVVAC